MRRYKPIFRLKRGQNRRFFIICSVLTCLIFIAVMANRSLKPISMELAESYGSTAVLEIINDSVAEYLESDDICYSDLVRLKYNSDGFVTSVEYDSTAINRMKIDCLKVLNKNLSKLKSTKIKVPVGSLFSDISLSGRGPDLSFKISESAVPDIEVISTFESVGLNQSRHEIRIRVSARVRIYLSPKSEEFTVSQDYVLAQTIIVGDVPSGYAFVE